MDDVQADSEGLYHFVVLQTSRCGFNVRHSEERQEQNSFTIAKTLDNKASKGRWWLQAESCVNSASKAELATAGDPSQSRGLRHIGCGAVRRQRPLRFVLQYKGEKVLW